MQAEENTILMLAKQLFLALCGMTAGGATAAGTFAFVIIIGVVPRLIAKFKRAEDAIIFENTIMLGGVTGSILSLFLNLRIPFGNLLLLLFGFSAGIFVGGISVALAEILNTFPILFRRFHIKRGLFWVMASIALGKLWGALFFFIAGMSAR